MGLRSPFGNGPQDVPSPVPNGMTLASMQQAEQKMPGLIPKVNVPGREPFQAPSQPQQGQNPDQDLLNAAQKMNPDDMELLMAARKESEPQSRSLQENMMMLLAGKDGYKIGKDGSMSILNKRTGKMEELTGAKKEIFDQLSTAIEPKVIAAKGATGLATTAAPIAAGIAGSMIPGVGPVAGPVAAGVAGFMNQDLSNWIHDLAGVKDKETRNRLLEGVVNLIGAGIGQIGGSVASRAEQGALSNASGAATAPAEEAASQEAAQQFKSVGVQPRTDQIQPTNPNVVTGVNKSAAAYPLEAASVQAEQNRQLVSKIDNLPGMAESRAATSKGYSFRDYLDNLREIHHDNIGVLDRQANEYAMGMTHDATPIIEKIKAEATKLGVKFSPNGSADYSEAYQGAGALVGEYNRLRGIMQRRAGGFAKEGHLVGEPQTTFMAGARDNALPPGTSNPETVGTLNMENVTPAPSGPTKSAPVRLPDGRVVSTQAATEMAPPNIAGEAKAGIKYNDLKQTLDTAKAQGNFKPKGDVSGNTPLESAWQHVYGQAADVRDDFAQKIFNSPRVQRPELANDLQFWRKNYTDLADNVKEVRDMIAKDPSNVARTLLNPNNPDVVAKVMSVASPSQQPILKGMYLEQMIEPKTLRPTAGNSAAYVDAESIRKQWDAAKREPKFMDRLYPDPKERKSIDEFINVGRLIQNRQLPIAAIQDDPLVKKATSLLMDPSVGKALRQAPGFIQRILGGTNPVSSHIMDRVYSRYPMTSAQYSNRANIYGATAGLFKGATPAMGAGGSIQQNVQNGNYPAPGAQ